MNGRLKDLIDNQNMNSDSEGIEDGFEDEIEKKELEKYKKVKNIKGRMNLDKEMEKYKGKVISYGQEDEDDSIEEGDWEDEEGEEIEGDEEVEIEEGDMEGSLNEADEEKEGSEVIEELEDNGLNEQKDQMDREDEEYLKKISHYTPNEIRKGKNVTNQKNLYEFFIGLRISLQKVLSQINSLPQGGILKKLIDESNEIILQQTISDLLKLLLSIINFQKELINKNNLMDKKSSQEIQNVGNFITQLISELGKNTSVNECAHELDEIIKLLHPIYAKVLSTSEKIMNIWYRKTLIYAHKSSQKTLRILNNNYCEHIKSSIENNYSSIRQKTKKKLQAGDKILGKKSTADEFDDEIYNDHDFYTFLLKEFISGKVMDSSEAADGSRMDLTLQYLLNRNQSKKSNKVDTRASKNRKLRFDKHEKLINFMVPISNDKLNPGRQEIINSIFGRQSNTKTVHDLVEEDSDFEII